MAVVGIGIDLIEVERVAAAISRQGEKFLARLFTQKERGYCESYSESARHFAGRFAAKEAIVKALGTGFGKDASWHDIEILNDERGKPFVTLHSKELKEQYSDAVIHISITHGKEMAAANAVIER